MRHLTALVLLCAAPAALASQELAMSSSALGSAGARHAHAARAATPPVLDGRGDDPAWLAAQRIDGFLEYEPNEGAESRFRTEARVLYDDRYLYVLVRMYDPAPDSIVSLLSRRDVRTNSEQLKLVIDSYHDRRTAYQFAVNPAGVKRDFYVYNDAIEDGSWDAVWDVATAIDSLGWVAEFRIPFSQLRFANRDEHTFGLLIVRDVARTGARISWPLYRRNQQGYVSQAGELGGITGIPSPRRLEVTPYVVAANESVRDAAGFGRNQRLTGGADIKYGVTSNLTLDATVNPDFGQVEADPAVLNLTAFETFREERRPFFLEGTGIFTFDVHCGDIDSQCRGLFYSRRIGRSPQLLGSYGDHTSPTATTIVGAAKLTGRLGGGLSIGVLDAVTAREVGTLGRPVEPRTNYLVARASQDLRNGRSGIGAMITAVHRDLDEHSSPLLRRQAYAGGVDARHRFLDDRYQIAAYVAASTVEGSEEAIARTQLDGVHFYQRPDGATTFDPTLTRLSGNAQRLSVSKFGGGITRFQTVYQRFSPGFEINDVGFLTRADEQLLRNWFAFQFNRPTRAYRRMFLNFNQWTGWNAAGMRTDFGVNWNGHVELPNTWWLHAGLGGNAIRATYSDRAARGGPAVRQSPSWEGWAGVEGDRRWTVIPVVFGGAWTADEGESRGYFFDTNVELRLSTRLSARFGPSFQSAVRDKQWFRNFGDVGSDTTHYTFARLDQKTLSLTTRLNYTHSPTLSFQFYAQPFISVGDYSNWTELDQPRAADRSARYRPYGDGADPGGLDFKQLRTNAVLRWEYRPGSALFVVWSQGREGFEPVAATFAPGRNLDDLFGLYPENTFLVKISYWLNP
ncbi:MAG TPA: DUF5916 domain-containing protein [Gemmatimonadaceae bacterium]|nr:DUF5916 domain-containing protein [Gemmatimonadaceae bacterium]